MCYGEETDTQQKMDLRHAELAETQASEEHAVPVRIQTGERHRTYNAVENRTTTSRLSGNINRSVEIFAMQSRNHTSHRRCM